MSYLGNPIQSVAFLTNQFSGNGSTVAFTLSVAPATSSSLLVSISGVLQDPSVYSVNGTTITFSGAPPAGTGNISVRYLGIPAAGIATTAYRTVTEFTATAGQTTFTPPSYTIGYIAVYLNGARLASDDFTASDGVSVVLTVGASVGDSVVTESFYVSSVLNAIPAVSGAINSTYLANNAVITSKIQDANVTTAKIADANIITAKIADANITQAKLAPNIALNGPAFSYYQSTQQTGIGVATSTKINFQTAHYDTTGGMYANSRFTPTIAGWYYFNAAAQLPAAGTTSTLNIALNKNGGEFLNGSSGIGSSILWAVSLASGLIYLNGTGDYVEVYTYGSNNGSAYSLQAQSSRTYFQGALIKV